MGLGARDPTRRHACRDRSADHAVARLHQTGPGAAPDRRQPSNPHRPQRRARPARGPSLAAFERRPSMLLVTSRPAGIRNPCMGR